MQVMLVVDGAGEADTSELQGWEGLKLDYVVADRGDVVQTDLVVEVSLRSECSHNTQHQSPRPCMLLYSYQFRVMSNHEHGSSAAQGEWC